MNTNEQNTSRRVVSVTVSRNPHKEKEMLDKNGNVIDPRTKQVIKKAEDNK